MKKYLFLFLLSAVCMGVKAQVIEFQYWDSVVYRDATFIADETYLCDINDAGVMVGYFKNQSGGRTAFLYQKNGEFLTYDHPSYTNTEFTGVNNQGQIVGKAYTTLNTALPLIGTYSTSATGITLGNFYQSSYGTVSNNFKDPRKISNDGFCTGTFQSTGNYRWINIEEQQAPWSQQSVIVTISSTLYNTYGLGINDNHRVTGYFLDGSEYRPVYYDPPVASNFSFPSHVNSSIGVPGTKFNDISNDDYLAIEYKDNTNTWQGTVGYIGTLGIMTYQANFPFQTPQGSAVLGINNNHDIVGYYKRAGGKVIAYFATTKEFKIPDFEIPDHVFPFGNYSAFFEYNANYDYDYISMDPHFQDNTNFYQEYLDNSILKPLIADGDYHYSVNLRVHPSWPAYVLSVGEQAAYMTMSSGKKEPKMEHLYRWLKEGRKQFKGNCYGMSYFALQHFYSDVSVTNRFPNVPSYPELQYYSNLSTTADSLAMREAITALHLYQFGQHTESDRIQWDWFLKNSGVSLQARYDSLATLIDKMAYHFYDNIVLSEPYHGLYFSAMDINLGYKYAHEVAPYKLSRYPSLTTRIDTIYCLDPNIPGSYLRLVVDYNNLTTNGYAAGSTTPCYASFLAMCPTVNLADQNIDAFNVMKPCVSQQNKSNGSGCDMQLTGLCWYDIVNQQNAAESVTFNTSGFTNTFSNLYPVYNMDEDTVADYLESSAPVALKSTLQSCDTLLHWGYSYPKGEMFFARKNILAAQSDIVYNDGQTMKIENPDNVDKRITFASIFQDNTEESTISIDSFLLKQQDSVTLTVLDQYHVKLSNDNTYPSDYHLFVRYLGDTSTFTWNNNGLNIPANTDHIIVLQPEDPLFQVIILVDSLQDGSIDDTLTLAGPNGLMDNIYGNESITLSPNPVQNILHLNVEKPMKSLQQVQVVGIDGRVLHSYPYTPNGTTMKLQVGSLTPGVYLLRGVDAQGRMMFAEKFIKQ
ncbi:MAG: T9SS type A sorting domain-containing protein [Chitinophagaceae bacterium]|nr:T9SS type A sorting domain-containing protein [Chitinophagaceae bacterium]